MGFVYWFQQPNHTFLGPLQVSNPIAIPLFVLVAVLVTGGFIGNIMVIGAVIVTKQLRTVGNIFVVNLAVADFLVTCFVQPMAILGALMGEMYFADRPAVCTFIATICLMSCYSSLLCIGTISCNRYVQICHPNIYPKIFKRHYTVLIAIGAWVLSFCYEVPLLLGWGEIWYDRKMLICIYNRTVYSYAAFRLLVGVFLPLFVILISYKKIYDHTKASRMRVEAAVTTTKDASGKGGGKEQKDSVKLARTMFFIFATYVICWTPYCLFELADRYDQLPYQAYIFGIVLAHINSSLDSVVYGLTNRHFRNGYIKVLGLGPCLQKIRGHRNFSGTTNGGGGSTVKTTLAKNNQSTMHEKTAAEPEDDDIVI